jgi:hypothetical protein
MAVKISPPSSDPAVANVTSDELSTNQQGTSIPYLAGTNKTSLRWIMQAKNQFTRPAPVKRPGKK